MKSLNNFIVILLKVAASLLLATVLLIKYIEQDKWVHNLIEQAVEQSMISGFQLKQDSSCYAKIKSINFFRGSITLDKLIIKNNWIAKAYNLTAKVSLLNYINTKLIDLNLNFSKTRISANFDNGEIDFVESIKAFIEQPSDLPLSVSIIDFHNAKIKLKDKYNNILETKISNTLSFYDAGLLITYAIKNGDFYIQDKKIITDITGSGRANVPFKNINNWTYKLFIHCDIFNKKFRCVSSYAKQEGFIKLFDLEQNIFGECNFNNHTLYGTGSVYGKEFSITSLYNNTLVTAKIDSKINKLFSIYADYSRIDKKLKLKAKIHKNNNKIRLSSISDFMLKKIAVKYACDIKNHKLTGKIITDFEKLEILGNLNDHIYNLNFDINKLLITDANFKQDNKWLLRAKDNVVVINLALMQKISDILNYNIQSTGKLILALNFNKQIIKVLLNNGVIKTSAGINFIQDISTEIIFKYLDNLIISAKDLNINLYKGQIKSPEINLIVDLYKPKILWGYIPVTISDLFISWNKMLLGIGMGNLVLNYKNYNQELIDITGQCYLAQSKFKANILSFKSNSNNYNSLPNKNINFNVDIKTKNPIDIDTELFKGEGIVNAHVSGSLSNMILSGSAEILRGLFNFPYKPLYIKNGIITLGNPIMETSINVTGRNTIQEYNIIMNIMGNLNNPEIKFSSSPNLTDEQILALLLSGSENTPLMFIMPNMVMQNLNNFVFGVNLLQNIFKPLKYIRVAPDKVEVELTDKLRAKIKNDSNIPEMQYELEYGITDDIKVKAIKDFWGGVGPEIEMRWKF